MLLKVQTLDAVVLVGRRNVVSALVSSFQRHKADIALGVIFLCSRPRALLPSPRTPTAHASHSQHDISTLHPSGGALTQKSALKEHPGQVSILGRAARTHASCQVGYRGHIYIFLQQAGFRTSLGSKYPARSRTRTARVPWSCLRRRLRSLKSRRGEMRMSSIILRRALRNPQIANCHSIGIWDIRPWGCKSVRVPRRCHPRVQRRIQYIAHCTRARWAKVRSRCTRGPRRETHCRVTEGTPRRHSSASPSRTPCRRRVAPYHRAALDCRGPHPATLRSGHPRCENVRRRPPLPRTRPSAWLDPARRSSPSCTSSSSVRLRRRCVAPSPRTHRIHACDQRMRLCLCVATLMSPPTVSKRACSPLAAPTAPTQLAEPPDHCIGCAYLARCRCWLDCG